MNIKFQLDPEEALVFYNLLSQIDEEGELTYGSAERKLVRGLMAIIEERLEFSPDTDYDALVNQARAKIEAELADSTES